MRSRRHGEVDHLGPAFVSYRDNDGTDRARDLAWAMRSAGLPVWLDKSDLPPGETSYRLKEALAKGLSAGVLLVTPDSRNSSVIRRLELPRLLRLGRDPDFILAIANVVPRCQLCWVDSASWAVAVLAIGQSPIPQCEASAQPLTASPFNRIRIAAIGDGLGSPGACRSDSIAGVPQDPANGASDGSISSGAVGPSNLAATSPARSTTKTQGSLCNFHSSNHGEFVWLVSGRPPL
jgi:hypothetical protein